MFNKCFYYFNVFILQITRSSFNGYTSFVLWWSPPLWMRRSRGNCSKRVHKIAIHRLWRHHQKQCQFFFINKKPISLLISFIIEMFHQYSNIWLFFLFVYNKKQIIGILLTETPVLHPRAFWDLSVAEYIPTIFQLDAVFFL